MFRKMRRSPPPLTKGPTHPNSIPPNQNREQTTVQGDRNSISPISEVNFDNRSQDSLDLPYLNSGQSNFGSNIDPNMTNLTSLIKDLGRSFQTNKEEIAKALADNVIQMNLSIHSAKRETNEQFNSLYTQIEQINSCLRNLNESQQVIIENRERINRLEDELTELDSKTSQTQNMISRLVTDVTSLKDGFLGLASSQTSQHPPTTSIPAQNPHPTPAYRHNLAVHNQQRFDGDNISASTFIKRVEQTFLAANIQNDDEKISYFLQLMTGKAARWAEGVTVDSWEELENIFLNKWHNPYIYEKKIFQWRNLPINQDTDLEAHLIDGLRLVQKAYPSRTFAEWASDTITYMPYKIRNPLLLQGLFHNEQDLIYNLRVATKAADINEEQSKSRPAFSKSSNDSRSYNNSNHSNRNNYNGNSSSSYNGHRQNNYNYDHNRSYNNNKGNSQNNNSYNGNRQFNNSNQQSNNNNYNGNRQSNNNNYNGNRQSDNNNYNGNRQNSNNNNNNRQQNNQNSNQNSNNNSKSKNSGQNRPGRVGAVRANRRNSRSASNNPPQSSNQPQATPALFQLVPAQATSLN